MRHRRARRLKFNSSGKTRATDSKLNPAKHLTPGQEQPKGDRANRFAQIDQTREVDVRPRSKKTKQTFIGRTY